jgi:hypothetical protein
MVGLAAGPAVKTKSSPPRRRPVVRSTMTASASTPVFRSIRIMLCCADSSRELPHGKRDDHRPEAAAEFSEKVLVAIWAGPVSACEQAEATKLLVQKKLYGPRRPSRAAQPRRC